MFKNRKNLVSISSLGGKKQWKKSRSNCPEVFCQKEFLKISQNSQESTYTEVFYRSQLFSCEFCEIFKNTYFVKQNSERLLYKTMFIIEFN